MYKRLIFMLMVLAVVGLAVPASAADYWLAGDWNAWSTTTDQMTDNSDGTFTGTITGLEAGSRQTFKFYESEMETWSPGENSWLYADGDGAITIGYNTNVVSDGWLTDQYRIGLSTDGNDVGWTIAGSFGWSDNPEMPGGAGGVDWNTSAHQMTDDGGGMYSLTMNLPSGGAPSWTGDPTFNTYAWKAVITGVDAWTGGDWDSICEDTRSVNTANAFVVVSPGNEVVNFYVDAYTGVVKSEVIPEPVTIALLGLGGLALLRRKR